MIKELEIAQKLKKCNETIRNLFKDDFDKEMLKYKPLIKAAMRKHSLKSELEGAMRLIEDYGQHMDGADMFAVKTYAACVELMEGRD